MPEAERVESLRLDDRQSRRKHPFPTQPDSPPSLTPPTVMSFGNASNSRELAGSFGIAIMGAILVAQQRVSLAHGATAEAAFVDGYSLALLIAAGVMHVGAAVAALALSPDRPAPVRPLLGTSG